MTESSFARLVNVLKHEILLVDEQISVKFLLTVEDMEVKYFGPGCIDK